MHICANLQIDVDRFIYLCPPGANRFCGRLIGRKEM